MKKFEEWVARMLLYRAYIVDIAITIAAAIIFIGAALLAAKAYMIITGIE